MPLHLVRCPFCGTRFDVSGIAPGTRLRCSGCTAVLAVPSLEVRRTAAWRAIHEDTRWVWAVAGGIGVLAIAVILYILLGTSSAPVSAPVHAAVAAEKVAKAPEPPPQAPPQPPLYLDNLSRGKQAIFDEFGTGFLLYDRVKPYLLAVEYSERYIGTDLIVDYGKRLEALYAAFRRELGDGLEFTDVDEALPVVVLDSRESFDRYCERAEKKKMSPKIKGMYEYTRRRIVIYHGSDTPYVVLFHEGVHQLVDYYARLTTGGDSAAGAYWFQEGLATFFEGFRYDAAGGIDIDPGVNRRRLPIVKQAVLQSRGDFIPIGVLLGLTVDDFWDWFEKGRGEPDETARKAQLYYAESWAFVYFLRQKGGAYRKTFDEYVLAEIGGKGGKEVFAGLLKANLDMELSHLEQEFVDYIRTLP